MTKHREGINTGFLTKHRLRLSELNPAIEQEMLVNLDQLPGVDRVWTKPHKRELKVAYDGSLQNIDNIIAVIEGCGATLKGNWWDRWRLNMQRQTDQNIRDNAKHDPHCCNKLPPGAGSRR